MPPLRPPRLVRLGDIKGRVGTAEQEIGIVAVIGKERDAEAESRGNAEPVTEIEGFFDRRLQPVEQDGKRADLVQPLDGKNEFIAAKAREKIALAQQGAQTRRKLAQQQVPAGMAPDIIDRLEIIEIEEADGKKAALTPRARNRALDMLLKLQTIGKAGQSVVAGEMELLLPLILESGFEIDLVQAMSDELRHLGDEIEHLLIETIGKARAEHQGRIHRAATKNRRRRARNPVMPFEEVPPPRNRGVGRTVIAIMNPPRAQRPQRQRRRLAIARHRHTVEHMHTVPMADPHPDPTILINARDPYRIKQATGREMLAGPPHDRLLIALQE